MTDVVHLSLHQDTSMLHANRKTLIVDGGGVMVTFEFPVDATIRNPDGMRRVSEALVELVRDSQKEPLEGSSNA